MPPGSSPGGTSSPGILSDGTLYVSGHVGEDAKTHKIPAEFEAEVKTCLSNISLVLKAAGMDPKDVVAVQIYLTDFGRYVEVNEAYRS